MPTWLAIVIVAVVVAIVLLAIAGMVAGNRRRAGHEGTFEDRVVAANQALAAAHAADRGWEPATVETAARHAFAEQRPGVEVTSVALVQVIDPPGTDEDKAIFQFATADGGSASVTLGRRGGEWIVESIA